MNWISKLLIGLAIILATPALGQLNHLIEVTELKEHIQSDAAITIINASKKPELFIPNSIHLPRGVLTRTEDGVKGLVPTADSLQNVLQRLGITDSTHLVLYDNIGSCESARLWWILEYFNIHSSVLNGGIQAWEQEGLPVDSTASEPATAGDITISDAPNTSLIAFKSDLQAAISNHGKILDTRNADEYSGDRMKKGAFRAGHIPTAMHLDWANAVNYDGDWKFKSTAALRQLMANLQIEKDEDLIVYCQSGVRSAHMTYTLRNILGYEHVRNYDGSWIDWSKDSTLAIETGAFEPISELAASSAAPSLSDKILGNYQGYANYIWQDWLNPQNIFNPSNPSYFYWLVLVSILVYLLELAFPWRKNQAKIRKDFWLDAFYMLFNFTLFAYIISGLYVILSAGFESFGITIQSLAILDLKSLPSGVQLLLFFLINDFAQWSTHVALHRFDFLWRFHKVHHSVIEMGFAAHLRYHWMENLFYKPLKTFAVMIIGGFEPESAFLVHFTAIAIGHLNHANIKLTWGPLKYVLNNPVMHLWHHAKELPADRSHGVNFGISLSLWDYLFKKNHIPTDDGLVELGFEEVESFPKSFFGQLIHGWKKQK